MSLVLQAAGRTDIGLVRKNNEDNFGYDLRHGIFVVCDGMGGQQAGETASKIGVETVLEYFRQPPTSERCVRRGRRRSWTSRGPRIGKDVRNDEALCPKAAGLFAFVADPKSD